MVTRRIAAATALAAVTLSSFLAPGAPLTERASAAGRTVTVGPGADLRAAMIGLHAGDTLALRPGIYRTGMISPPPATLGISPDRKLHQGTAGAPITVRAADPRNRPLILGELKLWGLRYWRLDGLRVQAVDANRDALYLGGGQGWVVRGSEFFGASSTNAFSNVTIGSDLYGSGAPRGFTFTDNCVHDAGRSTRNGTDHNIYVSFAGDAASGGVISRNVIFNHANGVGIKLGDGGVPRAPGPWNVTVAYNTIAQGGRQIFLHGDVRNNTVARNLLSSSTQRFPQLSTTTSVYLNKVVGAGNTFVNNYAASSTLFAWGGSARIGVDNAVRANPRFAGSGCSGFRPGVARAALYGRYGTGALPTR